MIKIVVVIILSICLVYFTLYLISKDMDRIREYQKSRKSFDKFDEELFSGDTVDVQSAGEFTVYKKDDGFLYFKPYGEEEKVSSYFKNDIIKMK